MSDEQRLVAYRTAALKLRDYLDAQLQPESGYPDRPSWGYAFTALLAVSSADGVVTPMAEKALRCLASQNGDDANYSWEFVVYAVQRMKRLLPSATLPKDIDRAKGTRMLNWFLLRQLNRGWFGKNALWTLAKVRLAMSLYTSEEGLIMDELRTRSFQYHAFCLFVICELLEQHPSANFLRRWLAVGADFSVRQMLADGSMLWLGRGQEQIFGYGALVYSLEYVNRYVFPLPIESLNLLQQHVLSFQRQDGSFPLVLRRREPESRIASFRQAPPGWYGYNTLYDYQPFLGYTLLRTSMLNKVHS